MSATPISVPVSVIWTVRSTGQSAEATPATPLQVSVAQVHIGLKGAQGLQGLQGLQGYKGDKGDKGDIGDVTPAAEAARNASQTARDDALTHAGTAGAQAGVATTKAGEAAASVVLAETARDAAFVNANVYADVATGLAAVADGVQFQVVDGEKLTRYRRDAGPVATPLLQIYLTAFFNSLFGAGFASERTGSLFSWLDSDGRLLAEIKTDGTLWSKGVNVTSASGIALSAEAASASVEFGADRTGYLHAFVDGAGKVLGGFSTTGEFVSKGLSLTAIAAAVQSFGGSTEAIFAWGDSLTENGGGAGGWIALLSAALGRTVNNRGIGGQGVSSIFGRQGSYPVSVTVDGNEIPASGPVNVTVTNQILNSSGTVISAPCSINGIVGVLSKVGAQYVFTRSANGAAKTVYPGTAVLVTPDELAKFATNIFWVGRNHFNYAQSVASYDAQKLLVLDAVSRGVKFLRLLDPRFIVIGVTNGSTEPAGTDGYNAILDMNVRLQAAYPREFLDIRQILLNSGTGADQDAIDFAAGVIPASLRSDSQHFSAAGNAVIYAAVLEKINQLGI